MADKLPKEQMVSLEELVMSHAYEMVALITVLEKKGILKRDEKRFKSSSGKTTQRNNDNCH